jgi:hypothetical protein
MRAPRSITTISSASVAVASGAEGLASLSAVMMTGDKDSLPPGSSDVVRTHPAVSAPSTEDAIDNSAVFSLSRSAARTLASLTHYSSRFVSPAPNAEEIVAVLRSPLADVIQSERFLCVFGSLLMATAPGRHLLEDILRRSMCAELLGCIIDGESLRDAAEKWRMAAVADWDGAEASSTFLQLCTLLSNFVGRYIKFNAPHYINLGLDGHALSTALDALYLSRFPDHTSDAPGIVFKAMKALERAELVVFERIVFEPLSESMRSQPGIFAALISRMLRSVSPVRVLSPLPTLIDAQSQRQDASLCSATAINVGPVTS